jgi:hypothetical protein
MRQSPSARIRAASERIRAILPARSFPSGYRSGAARVYQRLFII